MYTFIYYSPTGNAKYLTKKLAQLLDGTNSDILPMEFSDPEKLTPNKHLVIVYPVHGFNAPRTVKRFVKNLPQELYNVVSLIAVGCTDNWMNAAVSSDLRKELNKKAYSIALDTTLAMPLTFIANFPDELNFKLIAKAEENLKEISQAIVGEKVTVRNIEFKSKLLNFIGKAESPAARVFGLELHSNKSCDSCGTCWTNCPEMNITEKNGNPSFGFNCSMCMRCIYNCPQSAISPRFSKFIPLRNGYKLSKYIKE